MSEPGRRNPSEEFAARYLDYLPRVLNYMRFRGLDEELAQDLTARTFERALAKRHSLRDEGAFGGWLFRIAHNTLAEHFRRARPQVSLEAAAESGVPLAADGRSPEEALLQAEQQQAIRQLVGRLGERDREILGLKFMAELGNQEIASLLRLTPNHVGVLLYRALQRLRRMMDEDARGG
ncbi:MAG: sigma-70 family RNA polymerase sigma factor [Chloroflexi bacterium]|nr:sigma-70 family RNA polymerase sigma factor [Chloroflexota bacterium]